TPVEIAFPPVHLVDARGARTALGEVRGRNVGAFCGIGNPDAFRRTLDDLGAETVRWRTFPDHHHYTADELREIAAAANDAGAMALVTTLKDLVKVDALDSGGLPLWAVNIGANPKRGKEALERHLNGFAAAADRAVRNA